MKRSTKLEVRGNVYDLDYPNTGQQIDIELLKAKISDGNYDILRFSSNPLFQQQADIIDMIATFNVLIPKLKKDLNVDSFFKLEEEHTEVLLTAYIKVFMPWYTAIKTAIRTPQDQISTNQGDKDLIPDKE